jgi:hypothetical protein
VAGTKQSDQNRIANLPVVPVVGQFSAAEPAFLSEAAEYAIIVAV